MIKLENEKELSLDLVRSLLNQLNKTIENARGREIIHDLCLEVEEFLYINNKLPSKSFFDQMHESKLKQDDTKKFQIYEKVKKVEDVQLVRIVDFFYCIILIK